MNLYSLVFIILSLLIIEVSCRRLSLNLERRNFWNSLTDKLKDKTKQVFQIDFRHFDDEGMVLFPDVGYQTKGDPNKWKLMVHGWRYENSKKKDWIGISATQWVERLAKQFLNPDEVLYLNGSLNHDRLKPFFVEDESNELILLRVGNKDYPLITNEYGQFYDEIEFTNEEVENVKREQQKYNDIIVYEATGDNRDKAAGVIRLIQPPQGISVISDIDDTIKISEVLDKVRLIANTFIHPFKPVPGMSELYQQWYSKNNNCTFHYLSGMPDQLYTLTQEFIYTNNFPDGSFHMRHFGWAAASLFNFLHSESTFNHKISYLRFFLSNTIRDFILVGDSGEKDPEIYGTITREYPERVRAIFIRAIKNEKFDDERFVNAFQGIPQEKWQIFDDPSQLPLDLSKPPRSTMS